MNTYGGAVSGTKKMPQRATTARGHSCISWGSRRGAPDFLGGVAAGCSMLADGRAAATQLTPRPLSGTERSAVPSLRGSG